MTNCFVCDNDIAEHTVKTPCIHFLSPSKRFTVQVNDHDAFMNAVKSGLTQVHKYDEIEVCDLCLKQGENILNDSA